MFVVVVLFVIVSVYDLAENIGLCECYLLSFAKLYLVWRLRPGTPYRIRSPQHAGFRR